MQSSHHIIIIFALALLSACSGVETASRIDAMERVRLEEPDDQAALPDRGELEDYVAFALRRHPELRAQHLRWRAAVARIEATGRLPEPTLSLMVAPLPIETRLGPQRFRVGVMQGLPWPGRLDQQQEVAAAAADVEAQRFAAALVVLRSRVARLYWGLWLLDEEARLIEQQVTLVEGLLRTLQGALEVGRAPASALTQANLEISDVRDRLASVRARREAQQARFAAALGVERPDEAFVLGQAEEPTAVLPEADAEELVALAQQHPEVLILREVIEQRAEEVELARMQARPSFGLGADYVEIGAGPMGGDEAGRDALMLMGQVSLPLWLDSYESAVDAAQASRQAAEAELEAARLRIAGATRATLRQLQETARRVELIEDTLLPQAQANFEATLGDYETGEATAAELLQAQRRLLALRLELARALSAHANAWVELEELVGEPLPRRQIPEGTR